MSAVATRDGVLPSLSDAASAYLGAGLTTTGLVLNDPEMPDEIYEEIGRWLGLLRDATAWALGDWVLFGEGTYGEKVYGLAEAAGRSAQTIKNYRWVAYSVARSRRRDSLSWSHHEAVAALSAADQRKWLDRAVRDRLSVQELRGAIKGPLPEPGEVEVLPPPAPRAEVARRALEVAVERGVLDEKEAWDALDEVARLEKAAGVLPAATSNGEVCPECGKPLGEE